MKGILTCNRCGHSWRPQLKTGRLVVRRGMLHYRAGAIELPKRCARCKSPYWNRPRKKLRAADLLRMSPRHLANWPRRKSLDTRKGGRKMRAVK